jgi:fatty-acid desaturase
MMQRLKAAILTLGQFTLIPAIVLSILNPPSTGWLVSTIIFSYIFSVLGWIIAQHRLFSHKQFKVNRPTEIVLSLIGVIGTWQSPIEWAAIHLKHHRFADTEQDVHSTKYLGWKNAFFIFHNPGDFKMNMAIGRLAQDRWHLFLVYFKYIIIAMYAGIVYNMYGIEGITYLWLVPTAYSFLSQILIVLNHHDGHPCNSNWVNWFTLGEGNHQDHHDNTSSYQTDYLIKPIIDTLKTS